MSGIEEMISELLCRRGIKNVVLIKTKGQKKFLTWQARADSNCAFGSTPEEALGSLLHKQPIQIRLA